MGCTNTQLVLNDVYIHGGRVLLSGSTASSLVDKKVKILFGTANKHSVKHGFTTFSLPLPVALG